MKILIENFRSFIFMVLLTTEQINDVHFKYETVNISTRNNNVTTNKTKNDTIRNFLNICYHNIDFNYMPCYITLVPCGDLNDWNLLDLNLKYNYNNSVVILDINTYKSIIDYRKELVRNLNHIGFNLRRTNIINIVQEKKLGRNGNSLYYQKIVRKFDVPDNYYVSFDSSRQKNWATIDNYKTNCDFVEVTMYDPSRYLFIHKTVSIDYLEKIKKEYPKLFTLSETTQSTRIDQGLKNETDFFYSNNEHPILKLIRQNFESKEKISNFTNSSVDVRSNDSNPNKTTLDMKFIRHEELKFHYRYNQDKIKEINQIFKTYMKLSSLKEDYLLSYAVIQEKTTGEIYMHIRTKSGINYLNHLESIPNHQNNFIFKFKKSNSLTLRIKSLESWNVIRYEIYVPNTNCTNNNDQNIHVSLENNNCDNFDEKSFFDDLNQREPINKYKEFYAIISYENRMIYNYDQYKCILIEYFGKILTCDGKIISVEEYGFLKTKNLFFIGLILLNHGKVRVVRIDNNGNIIEFKDAINTRPQHTSSSSSDPQTCHECAKVDLRAQVENTQAYNQYKKAIKIQSEGIEKYVILFLIFLVLSMFWFKQRQRKRKNRP